VYSNSNGNTSPITLGAGVKSVFGTLAADGIPTSSGISTGKSIAMAMIFGF
jgi:hypothetical protein